MIYFNSLTLMYLIVILFENFEKLLCQKSLSSIPCGKITRNARIVGGFNAKKGEIPYIASLTKHGSHFCGATILNDRFLVTAGHCVCNGINKQIRPTQIRGIVGLYRMSDFYTNNNQIDGQPDDANGPYEITFKNIIAHPSYICGRQYDDIALLELTKPIYFDKFVQPMCIAAPSNERLEGKIAAVSGWGWENEDKDLGTKSDTLKKAFVEIWNNEQCQNSFRSGKKLKIIKDTQMCASSLKVDACWADSGGPLITDDDTLVGVISTGIGCARQGFPGIYTRVSEYSEWIENIVAAS
uniref:Putative serine-type endopeptidase n=1 Tax=Corethrella appendiculata TaxID=1370023 RepID=U5EPL4_9DIPT